MFDGNHRTSCLLSKPASQQLPQVTETKPGPVLVGVGGEVEIRMQGRLSRGRKLDTALWKTSMWETAGCINLNVDIPGAEKAHPVYTERLPKWNFQSYGEKH